MSHVGTVVIARHWLEEGSELRYVTRLLAGAASRCGPVSVLVPGPPGTCWSDGAFTLEGIGEEADLRWPARLPGGQTVIVDELTPTIEAMVTQVDPKQALFLSAPKDTMPDGDASVSSAQQTKATMRLSISIFQSTASLNGIIIMAFGFTGYQLVLSDRIGPDSAPPDAAAWVTAAFVDLEVVVIEAATASAWKGRSLRGRVAIDTRMDLWRLIAHAAVCIDLGPGPYIGRECIEALRFGTPILVASDSGPAAVHAGYAGGSTYRDAAELLNSVSLLSDPSHHEAASLCGA